MPHSPPPLQRDANLAVRHWDVIVVGTGMGGATIGHALAQAGHSVLFLEKGHATFPDAGAAFQPDSEVAAERLKNGAWPTRMTAAVGGASTRFFAPLGCGAGGSTLLYSAALERFHPCDFTPPAGDPHHLAWPLSYRDLRPFYERAQHLFGVSGTDDPLGPDDAAPLRDPPPLSASDAHFFEAFQARGLHPYRLHVGIDGVAGCGECLGHLCRNRCKNDARKVCIEPALKTGNAHLLDDCEVQQVVADATSVREIQCRRHGHSLAFRARVVILAAGAYFSPALLLRSANVFWPQGLANSSGMVGCNLMFHVSDHLAVWPRRRLRTRAVRKALSFRDFYRAGPFRLGSVQSTGFSVGYGNVLQFMRTGFDRSRWRWARPLRSLLRLPALVASLALGRAAVFSTIMEDLPYPDNRVVLDAGEPSGIRIHYRIRAELRTRSEFFKLLIRKSLAPHRVMPLSREPTLNYGHPCGTCRFGADPSSSVLDVNNKAHGIENLFIVDASFMPTSGGANPALTIAANALRVGEHVSALLRADPAECASRA